eukprot:scaffold24514_cov36-Prasinocladus_malaysianus.AAC.1
MTALMCQLLSVWLPSLASCLNSPSAWLTRTTHTALYAGSTRTRMVHAVEPYRTARAPDSRLQTGRLWMESTGRVLVVLQR